MTPAIAAGGPTELVPEESPPLTLGSLFLRYAARVIDSGVYRVRLLPRRPTALIAPTEQGFVAECPELGSLGYGETQDAALDDLRAAIREYLTVLVEKDLDLAPSVAHHARYVDLLGAPEQSWFAAINVSKAEAPDAA